MDFVKCFIGFYWHRKYDYSLRPYHPERTRSRLISEAKQGRAWLVLGWEKIWSQMEENPNSRAASASLRKKNTGKEAPCPGKGACFGELGLLHLCSVPLSLAGVPRVQILSSELQNQCSCLHTKTSKVFDSGTSHGWGPKDGWSLRNIK